MLQFYADESQNSHPDLLVVAGHIANDAAWARFTDEWSRTLRGYRLPYFRMSEAMGEWSTALQRELVSFLRRIIGEHVAYGFVHAIDPTLLRAIFAGVDDPRLTNPYLFLFRPLIVDIARQVGAQDVSLTFDDRSDKRVVLSAWDAFQAAQPSHFPTKFYAPTFADDREVVPIQSADFLAWRNRIGILAREGRMPARSMPYDMADMSLYLVIRKVWTAAELVRYRQWLVQGGALIPHPGGFKVREGVVL